MVFLNKQSNLFEVEGFDRVVDKFQELNHSWQTATEEYRAIYIDSGRVNRDTHPSVFTVTNFVLRQFKRTIFLGVENATFNDDEHG